MLRSSLVGRPRLLQGSELGLQHADVLRTLLLQGERLLLCAAALLVRSGLQGHRTTVIQGDNRGLTLFLSDPKMGRPF